MAHPRSGDRQRATHGRKLDPKVQLALPGRQPLPGGGTVDLANEVHVPVGERVRFVLDSPDVIHAFWVPSLGGKVDMIPGRTTELVLEPDSHPAARPFKQALVEDGIPFTAFAVADVRAEHERLTAAGVRFTQEPVDRFYGIDCAIRDPFGNHIENYALLERAEVQ